MRVNGGSEQDRSVVASAIAKIPAPITGLLDRYDVAVNILEPAEFVTHFATHPHIDRVEALYLPAERTVYVKTVEEFVVVHELGHALDHALGKDRYLSSFEPALVSAFDRGPYVNAPAAAARDEFFAESFRAFVGANADERWPHVAAHIDRDVLLAKSPAMGAFFDEVHNALDSRGFGKEADVVREPEIARDTVVATRFVPELDTTPNPKWCVRDTQTGEFYRSEGESWPVRSKSRAKAEQLAAQLNRGERPQVAVREPRAAEPSTPKDKADFRTALTDELVKALEAGVAPWQKPWDAGSPFGQMPYNITTDKKYRGGNVMRLMLTAAERGYSDPRWMTRKQAEERGYEVRAGEKSTQVQYWKGVGTTIAPTEELEEGESPRRRRPVAFSAWVFNASQIDVPKRDGAGGIVTRRVDESGVVITSENEHLAVGEIQEKPVMVPMLQAMPLIRTTREFTPIEYAEKILHGSGAKIIHGGDRAFYHPALDEIHMPLREAFHTNDHYYSTLAHEIGHWTGHKSRLDRDLSGGFGSEKYAREELRAEIASMFLAAETGIPHDVDRHAPYVGNWVEVLRKDKHEIFRAATDAQKMTDYVVELTKTQEITNVRDASEQVEALAPAAFIPDGPATGRVAAAPQVERAQSTRDVEFSR